VVASGERKGEKSRASFDVSKKEKSQETNKRGRMRPFMNSEIGEAS